MDSFIKAFLLEKYGEKVYNLNSHLFEQSLKTLEDELANFTCDYYGAFKDCDFLFDVIIWKRMEEIKKATARFLIAVIEEEKRNEQKKNENQKCS